MGLENASADLAKTYGEENRCPVCGAFSRVDRDPTYRFVCAVCGAPRIGGKIKPTGASTKALVESGRAKRSAFAWRAASWAFGIPAALTLALAAVLAPQSFIAAGVLIAGGVFLAIAAARSSRQATVERKKLLLAWNEAWESAALALLDARGAETTAEDVAKELELPLPDAEALLSTLSAQSSVRVRIDEDHAKLLYESENKDAVGPPPNADDADAAVNEAAEAEAAVDEAAEAEAKAKS